jgi:hypothetical protein
MGSLGWVMQVNLKNKGDRRWDVSRVTAHDPEFIRSILSIEATNFGVFVIPFDLQMSRPRGKMLNYVFVFAQHHPPPPWGLMPPLPHQRGGSSGQI